MMLPMADGLGSYSPLGRHVHEVHRLLDPDMEQAGFESKGREACPRMGACAAKTLRCLDWLWALEEPKRTGCWADFVGGHAFQIFFASVIGANALFMALSLNAHMDALAAGEPVEVWSAHNSIEAVFVSVYCVELGCKWSVHGWYYLWNEDARWNWLDLLLVLQGVLDSLTRLFVEGGGSGKGKTWMRMIRLFKMARFLRILRVIRMFSQLTLLINCILESVPSLFWSVLLFLLTCLMFSMYFVSMAVAFMEESSDDQDQETDGLLRHFSSVWHCMLTLYQSVSGGVDWGDVYKELLPLGTSCHMFLVFIAFSQIALLNVVTGIFMETALKIAQGDLATKAQDEHMKEKEMAEELLRLFVAGDVDEDRKLTESEFRDMLESGRLERYLKYIGIDPVWLHENLPLMFQKLAMENSEKVDRGEEIQIDMKFFVHLCMMLRGAARSTELMDLQDRVVVMQQQMVEQVERFELLVSVLSPKVDADSVPQTYESSEVSHWNASMCHGAEMRIGSISRTSLTC